MSLTKLHYYLVSQHNSSKIIIAGSNYLVRKQIHRYWREVRMLVLATKNSDYRGSLADKKWHVPQMS